MAAQRARPIVLNERFLVYKRIFRAAVNTYVTLPIFRGPDARGGKNYEQAHTHTRDNHCNDNNNWRASEASEPLSYHVN